jgi:hypothetical protein
MEFVMDKTKAIEALVYIAGKIPNVGRFHAAKILYFAELYHLREFGRPIVGDTYIAMENGPVPSFGYDVLKGNVRPEDRPSVEGALITVTQSHYPKYCSARDPVLDVFSASDLACLDKAIEYCRSKSFGVISDETHEHIAWKNADLNAPMDYSDMLDGANPEIIEDAKLFAEYGVL